MPSRRSPEEVFNRIDRAIHRLAEINDWIARICSEAYQRLVTTLRMLANALGRFAREFFVQSIRGLWELCRSGAVILFFVYLTSVGLEMTRIGPLAVFGFLVWPIRIVGWVILLGEVLFFGAVLWAFWETSKPSPESTVERRPSTTTFMNSRMPGSLLLVDFAIGGALYGLTIWPPYWCKVFPLAATQQLLFTLVANFLTVIWNPLTTTIDDRAALDAYAVFARDVKVIENEPDMWAPPRTSI
jgi:hypothetical protein